MSMRRPSAWQIENYCTARILGKSKKDAFRFAFPDSKCSDKVAYNKGYEISLLPAIQIRLHGLRELIRFSFQE